MAWFWKSLLILILFWAAIVLGIFGLIMLEHGPAGTHEYQGRVIGLAYEVNGQGEILGTYITLDRQVVDGCVRSKLDNCKAPTIESFGGMPLSVLDTVKLGDSVTIECTVKPYSFDFLSRINCSIKQ